MCKYPSKDKENLLYTHMEYHSALKTKEMWYNMDKSGEY
jgi:hypothetical protein